MAAWLTEAKDLILWGYKTMPRRIVMLLLVVVLCTSAVAGYGLFRGLDGLMVSSYMGAMGLIFGASLGYHLRKRGGE